MEREEKEEVVDDSRNIKYIELINSVNTEQFPHVRYNGGDEVTIVNITFMRLTSGTREA